MNEPMKTVVPIYGGGASIDHRADGERQAQDYRASQRCQDWELIARGAGKPGGWRFFAYCVGVPLAVVAGIPAIATVIAWWLS